MHKPVTLAIIGAGKRGEAYVSYARQHPELAQVVAIAEPRKLLRDRMAANFDVPDQSCFGSYEDFASQPRMADAVAICTHDRMHCDSVEAIAPLGYSILLEKPMAPSLADCEKIGSSGI